MGVKVPIKEISEVQKAMGDHLLIMPRFKCVKGIEGDQARKCVLMRADANQQHIEEFAKEKGYEVTDENVTLGYDNLNMSK